MAIAVIGGLIASTLLSLVFVPAAFSLIDDFGRATWWLFGRFVARGGRTRGRTTRSPAEVGQAPDGLPAAAE